MWHRDEVEEKVRRDGAGRDGAVRIVLLGKPGCHLCEEARAVVARVAADLGVGWVQRSILEDPDLYERYCESIPVTLVDGVPHSYWRVDERRLRATLAAGPGGR
jgi:hypothetical protein